MMPPSHVRTTALSICVSNGTWQELRVVTPAAADPAVAQQVETASLPTWPPPGMRPCWWLSQVGSGRECWTPPSPSCAPLLALAPPRAFVSPYGALHILNAYVLGADVMSFPALLTIHCLATLDACRDGYTGTACRSCDRHSILGLVQD